MSNKITLPQPNIPTTTAPQTKIPVPASPTTHEPVAPDRMEDHRKNAAMNQLLGNGDPLTVFGKKSPIFYKWGMNCRRRELRFRLALALFFIFFLLIYPFFYIISRLMVRIVL